MSAPDLSQIKHEHIRQRAASKLAAKKFRDIIGTFLMAAVIAGLAAVFVGFLFFFISTMSQGYNRGASLLSSYLLAFVLIGGAVLAYVFSTEGPHSESELWQVVAADFQEDAELTRKEDWERGAPAREAARLQELTAQQAREAQARAEAVRAEAKRQYEGQMRDYQASMDARAKRAAELAAMLAGHFADFAMELHLQGVTDADTLARRYAVERLPRLVAENGDIGLVRDVRDRLTSAMQQVTAFLPPAPLLPAIPNRPALLKST